MDEKIAPLELQGSDWISIERLLEGDRAAFDLIFQKYKGRVFNLAFRFVRQREAAEDISQEIFIKIYQGKVKVDSQALFSTWLYRVTVNACLDFLRRKKFSPLSLDRTADIQGEEQKPLLDKLVDNRSASPRETLEKKELKALLRNEIDRLPEKIRAPILLYQFEERSYQEIAEILSITPKAVERRIYRAKETLRKKLSKVV